MILRSVFQIVGRSAWLRKCIWHRWYEYLAGYPMQTWRFMNYGYTNTENDETPDLELAADDEPDRLAIQLYHHVLGNVPIENQIVLEVGCGRGGGASFVARYLRPRRITAVDYSRKVIRLCQKNCDSDLLHFVHASAESLPFEDGEFDAVINVESSHCYGSMPAFLKEVLRVTRVGGNFCFADLRPRNEQSLLHQQISDSGWSIVQHADISANVFESMRRDNDRKQRLIDEWANHGLNSTIRQFAGVEGSEIFQAFQSGRFVYLRYLLQKT